MSIVLFAIIGASINAGPAYWICYAVFCMAKVITWVVSALNQIS